MPLWQPDTCSCKFDVSDDWLTASVVAGCGHHSTAPDPFVAVRNENAFKNVVVGFIVETYPDYDGTYTWGTGLQCHVAGLSNEQAASLQTALDDHFGIDEVTVA